MPPGTREPASDVADRRRQMVSGIQRGDAVVRSGK
jgi:hypothetical protein